MAHHLSKCEHIGSISIPAFNCHGFVKNQIRQTRARDSTATRIAEISRPPHPRALTRRSDSPTHVPGDRDFSGRHRHTPITPFP